MKPRQATMFPENPKSKDRRIEKIVRDAKTAPPGEWANKDLIAAFKKT